VTSERQLFVGLGKVLVAGFGVGCGLAVGDEVVEASGDAPDCRRVSNRACFPSNSSFGC